jgi:hypothetical protein
MSKKGSIGPGGTGPFQAQPAQHPYKSITYSGLIVLLAC